MAQVTLDTIAEAGVVGAGGAGFPTHVKLAGKADTVLLNAAECEPLLHKDKEVLRDYLDATIEGMAVAMQLVGADRAIVGIKEKYQDVIDLLRGKLPRGMEVCPLRDAYPAGDEFILVYDTLGRIIPPGGIPLNVNAVVLNVETAVNVAASASQPVTEKFLTIAGAVAEPITLRVPIGVTLAQCVAAAGGATVPDPNYMVGGVMMGTLQPDHEALVDKTTGGVIVLPDDHVVIRRRNQTWKQVARIGQSACDQCSYCTELCPRWLLGHPDRAAQGDAEPGLQHGRRGQYDRHEFLLRVQPVQPVFLPGGSRSQAGLHAEQAAFGSRKRSAGRTRPWTSSARKRIWATARRPWPA